MKLHRLNEMVCPICGLHVCKCGSEQEEVEVNGKKISIGRHSDKTDHHFDPHELQMGIEEEIKRIKDHRVAKAIAKDHLSEIPDFYSRIRKMKYGYDTFKGWMNKDG